LKPDSYWQRLTAQEQAGKFVEGIKTGLALANIFPQSPQSEAALLKAGELAQKLGRTEDALELFGLTISLNPRTPEASQACLAASALMLTRDLRLGNPIQSLRLFLGRTSHLPPGYSPESFREALKSGWQAVACQVQGTSPLPLSLVEDILALWDLQPKGLGPPEAARLIADLLQKKGLVEEAQNLLAGGADKNKNNQQNTLKSYSWKQSELSDGWAGLAGAVNQVSLWEMEPQFLASVGQLRWWARIEFAGTSGEDILSWFLPRPANAAWVEGRIPDLGKNLVPPWSPLLPDRPRYELAGCGFLESSFSQAAQIPQPLAEPPEGQTQGPFYQYCLGVNCLQDGHPEEAQANFQRLALNHDPFWQSLARVRLADLELSRLQDEPAP
jgi:tetratricopeptide (TPR) repeat protein